MRKLLVLAVAASMAAVLFGSLCQAEEASPDMSAYANILSDSDYYIIPEWDIMIPEPEDAICADEGDGFYIYPYEEGYIPYVMVTIYEGYDSEEEFFSEFTPYLQSIYDDLEIIAEYPDLEIDGGTYYEVDYMYTVEDAFVLNRCITREFNGLTFMYTSKEVPDMDLTVGDMLDEIVEGSLFIADGQPVTRDADYLRWDYIEEYVDEHIEGDFVQLEEPGMEMFVPDALDEYELTEEDIDDFFIYYAGNDPWTVTVQEIPVSEGFTVYDYRDMLESEDDVDYLQPYVINDRLFMKYEISDSDMICFTTVSGDSELIEFSFWPINDDTMWEYIEVMISSVRPADSE